MPSFKMLSPEFLPMPLRHLVSLRKSTKSAGLSGKLQVERLGAYLVTGPRLTEATTGFAWIVGFVKGAAALAFPGVRLRSQININLQQ
jgi:hypothetical protein